MSGIVFLERLEVFGNFRKPFQKGLFERGGIHTRGRLAALVNMFWQAVFAARGLEHASMDSNQPRPSIGFYVLFGLPHFDAASDEVVGYGIAVVEIGRASCREREWMSV